MIDWRTLLKPPPYPQYPQNAQNRSAEGHSEDFEDIEPREQTSAPTSPRFVADSLPARTDILDTVPSVSTLSVPFSENPAENQSPDSPLQSGWLVVHRDRQGVLRGGSDDRAHATVRACQWDGHAWRVLLTDGQRLPLTAITAVGQTDATGRLIAAWTVRAHGYDGHGDHTRGHESRNQS